MIRRQRFRCCDRAGGITLQHHDAFAAESGMDGRTDGMAHRTTKSSEEDGLSLDVDDKATQRSVRQPLHQIRPSPMEPPARRG